MPELPTAPLTDNELVSLLEQHRAASVTFFDDEIAQEQRESLDYYEGRPFGDEEVGRSQVVSRDVAEVVDWMMPDVLEIFAGDEDAVEFKARQDGPGPAEIARRATDCIRHTFWVDNDGVRIFHDWVKDSLIQKNGWIKVWWDESEQEIRQTVTNQSPLQIQLFEDDDTVEVVDSEETEIPNFEELARRDPNLLALFPDGLSMTATIVRRTTGGRLKYAAIPPENVLISPLQDDVELLPYLNHRERRPLGELVAEGLVTAEEAVGLAGDDGEADEDQDRRFQGEEDDEPDKALQREVWVYEEYLRADVNADGEAELTKVIRVGSTVLFRQQWDEIPIVTVTPNPMPHRIYGQSLADLARDIQRVNSVIWRQSLDNLYLANNPRKIVNESQALDTTYDDLAETRIGAVITVDGDARSAIQQEVTPFVGRQSFQMLEYVDTVRERRTGVTRLSQGLDSETLNETASGQAQLIARGQARKVFIIRLIAEAFGRLLRKAHNICRANQDFERQIELRGNFIPFDPRTWLSDFDVKVNVGLGNGNPQSRIPALVQVLSLQREAIAEGTGLADLNAIHRTLQDLSKSLGLDASRYFNMPQQAMPQQGTTEAETRVQVAQIQAQADIERARIEASIRLQIEREKLEAQTQLRIREQDLEARLTATQIGARVATDTNTNIRRQ